MNDPQRWICPKCRSELRRESGPLLVCAGGHRFPIVEGVPVLLRDDVAQTMSLALASVARARNEPGATDRRNPGLFLESLGISEAEKNLAVELARNHDGRVDPVVQVIVGATSGFSYKHLIGKLESYPIPEFPLPPGDGRTLLDVGCNWGRWSVAAAGKGYRVIGIDPSLGAIMAATRVAKQLGLEMDFAVADARHLPLRDRSMDAVFSYSVLQHFSRQDASQAIEEAGRVLKAGGNCLIQMAHAFGARSVYNQVRRLFRKKGEFDVRYWTVPRLKQVFEKHVGPATVSADCYFGLGLQASDRHLMPRKVARVVEASETLRKTSLKFPWLACLADSLYVSAMKS